MLEQTRKRGDSDTHKRDLTGDGSARRSMIAGYVDGTLDSSRKARVESHLARYERCRQITRILKAQREADLPHRPSAGLSGHPRCPSTFESYLLALGSSRSHGNDRGACSCNSFPRKPEQTLVLPSMHPPARLSSRSPQHTRGFGPDVVRKTATVELRPAVISPRAGSVLTPQD